MFIKLSDSSYPYTEQRIRAEFPNISFGTPFVAPADFAPVLNSPLPDYDPATEAVTILAPAKIGDVWMSQYGVRALTQEELDFLAASQIPASLPPVPPLEVTMRQARLALLDAGLLSAVAPAIAALASPAKEAAEIEWEYSQTVQRNNAFVASLSTALNLTEAQLDALFIAAAAK